MAEPATQSRPEEGRGTRTPSTGPATRGLRQSRSAPYRRARVRTMIVSMMLAGLRVSDDDVRELARFVDELTRSVSEKALALGTGVLALTIDDRERLLWALDDARTDALAELRAVLLLEHEGRVREGLV